MSEKDSHADISKRAKTRKPRATWRNPGKAFPEESFINYGVESELVLKD